MLAIGITVEHARFSLVEGVLYAIEHPHYIQNILRQGPFPDTRDIGNMGAAVLLVLIDRVIGAAPGNEMLHLHIARLPHLP